jgi:CRISPR-associated protein Cas1
MLRALLYEAGERIIESEDESADYLPARMVNEFAYCPRLFYLEHIDGLFRHNEHTVEGIARHVRVDAKTDSLPNVNAADSAIHFHARSVTLASERLQVVAKLDLVEVAGLQATPVDYKKGAPREMPDGSLSAWDPERIQICLQALLLRDNGYECSEGIIFFWETRQRVVIPVTDDLIEIALEAIRGARDLITSPRPPQPLVDSPKCPGCSMVAICLPDETNRCCATSHVESGSVRQPFLFDCGIQSTNGPGSSTRKQSEEVRRLVTARDERRPLYLNTQGLSVGISGKVLVIREKSKTLQEVLLKDVSQINLFGSIQVSTQAIHVLLEQEIPLVYFSFGGWFRGMTQPVGLKNVLWRIAQFRTAESVTTATNLSRDLVIGKIRNQRTMLLRNHKQPPSDVLRFLKGLSIEAKRAKDFASLLGVEGMAARSYFQNFAGMLKRSGRSSDGTEFCDRKSTVQSDPDTALEDDGNEKRGRKRGCFDFDFQRRNRRPPRDAVNALLSLGYSLLVKDLTIICASVGLDPFLGFYHRPRFGRPSLALDMMEPFRPLIVDSAVLSAVNQRMVTEKDFVHAGDAVALTAKGRKNFFLAYEQRMDQLVTHPLFEYRVSYRRIMEIQVRLLARYFLGEISSYPVFVTR